MEKQACTQNRSRTLKAIIKKAAISAAVIGMVFIMLFLDSCALLKNMDVKSMDKVYSSDIAAEMDVDDYNAKKDEFLNASTINLDADLQVVPENYYKQKFGLTDEQVAKQTIASYTLCLEDALYICGIYYDESTLEYKQTPRALVLKTLFRYKLDPAIIQDLVTAYNDEMPVKSENKPDYLEELLSIEPNRIDRINNYNYRYLLNYIISTHEPEIVAENYDSNSDSNIIRALFLEDFKISTSKAPMNSYKNGYHEIYFIGKRQYSDRNADLDDFESLYYSYDDIDPTLTKTKNDIIISPFDDEYDYPKRMINDAKKNIHSLGKILFKTKSYFIELSELRDMFYPDQNIAQYERKKYDNSGNLVRVESGLIIGGSREIIESVTLYDSDGKIESKEISSYNEKWNLVKITHYDSEDRVVLVINYSGESSLPEEISRIKYSYDEKGNTIIEKTTN